MTLYVDSSALLKRYIDEPESPQCERHLLADPRWVTAALTHVEVRRNLARLLDGADLVAAQTYHRRDWERLNVVALDARTLELAAEIAESTGARSLDALHLAAAMRLGVGAITVLTYDVRQAQVARRLGVPVIGV